MSQPGDLPTYHELRIRFEAMQSQLAEAERAARESELRRVALEGELEQLRLQLKQYEHRLSSERVGVDTRRRELDDARRDAEQARRLAGQRKRDLDQVLGIALVALRSVDQDIERVEASTAWRVGHRAARTAARARLRAPTTAGAVAAARARIDDVIDILVARRGELSGGPVAASDGPEQPPTPDAQARSEPPELDAQARSKLADAIRARLGPVAERSQWPGVSIIVRGQGGELLPAELLERLRETDYPALELIVVAPASAQRAAGSAESYELPFPIRVVDKDVDLTSSAAGNEAAGMAEHPLLLFLDPGAEPAEPGWCKELVHGLLSLEAGAIGATVLHGTSGPGAGGPHTQQPGAGGLQVVQRGMVLGRFAGLGEAISLDAGADPFGAHFGIEAACVASPGTCLLVDRAAFWRAGGFDSGYRDGVEHVELGLSLAAAGQLVACSGRAFVLHDQHPAGRAQGPHRRGQSLGARRLAERWGPALRRELRLGLARSDPAWVGDQTLHVAIARTSNDPVAGGHAAEELGDALGGLGWRVSYLESKDDSWYALPDGVDALLALSADFEPARLPPGVTAIAWVQSSPERWLSRPDFGRYDILLAASRRLAQEIVAATGREAVLFPPATNPSRFAPAEPIDELRCDYCLVGDRDSPREIDPALVPHKGEQAAFYGRGWSSIKTLRSHARDAVSYERMPSVYSSTQVLIDDGTQPEPDHRTLSAHTFDALASGTIVLTSCETEAREMFDEEFPVWSDAETLRAGLDALLGAPERRRSLGRRYRRRVLEEHTYLHRADRLRALIRDGDERLSFCLKIGAPDWRQAARWGDLYLARDLERALKRRGHRCLIQVLAEWDEPAGLGYDVVIHLRGRSVYAPRPGQFNVLWLLSHPTELSDDEASTYDLVCVASSEFAQELQGRVSVPVAVLEQATDPWRFYPDPDPDVAHELVFVGNARGSRRPVLDDLLPTQHDLAVWGSGLAGIVEDHQLQGDWFANESLRKVYSSAKLVLCDHWDEMRTHGFVSNRVYDAVASGAVVLTDAVVGLDGRFGDAVIPYASADQLRATVKRLLASDAERAKRADGARERVLRGHTFDRRVDTLLDLVDEHAAASGHRARVLAA